MQICKSDLRKVHHRQKLWELYRKAWKYVWHVCKLCKMWHQKLFKNPSSQVTFLKVELFSKFLDFRDVRNCFLNYKALNDQAFFCTIYTNVLFQGKKILIVNKEALMCFQKHLTGGQRAMCSFGWYRKSYILLGFWKTDTMTTLKIRLQTFFFFDKNRI